MEEAREILKKYSSLLSTNSVDYYARMDPELALEFSAEHLSKRTLEWCAFLYPEKALEFAKPYLTKGIYFWCLAQTKKGDKR